MSVGWQGSPEGFRPVQYNPDGTMRGRIPKEETEKRLAKHKADMASYEARTLEQEAKAIRKAAGVKEPVEIHAPKDVLDLTVMNLLADGRCSTGTEVVKASAHSPSRRDVLDSVSR